MSSSNFIDSSTPDKIDKAERNTFIYKLRIVIIFAFCAESQQAKSQSFRNGEKIADCVRGENLTSELSASKVEYIDEDEGNDKYLILDKIIRVDERSPKAMENLSKKIDDYVFGICMREDAEKVIPHLLIPSFGEEGSVILPFANSFPIKCFAPDVFFHHKLDTKNRCVLQFGFDEIKSHLRTPINSNVFTNDNPKPLTFKIFVLAAYYTYFYVDYLEHTKNSMLKSDLSEKGRIRKRVSKFMEGKKEKTKKNFWNKVFDGLQWSLKLPKSILSGTVDFLFNYDGHLENRIYSRINDVLDITCPDASLELRVDIISDIISKCHGVPISMYDFFDSCKYWKYSEIEGLSDECRKWVVDRCDRVQITGFAAILLKNGHNHIYSYKGTDFDSYGKDWICANLLQGLTGYSLQYHASIANAVEYDKEVKSGNLWFVGHSLGGGLASAAAIATKGRTAYTFNAAGLNVIGVKVNQLFHDFSSIIHPSQSWSRVFPYRIKGEVLDTLQKSIFKLLSGFTLERGYGINSVEFEMEKDISCCKRHGINNYLYNNVLKEVQGFNNLKADTGTNHNKIKKITFKSPSLTFTYSSELC